MGPLPGLLPSSLGVVACILLGSPAAPAATCTSLTSLQLPDTTIDDAGHPSLARSLKKLHARAGLPAARNEGLRPSVCCAVGSAGRACRRGLHSRRGSSQPRGPSAGAHAALDRA